MSEHPQLRYTPDIVEMPTLWLDATALIEETRTEAVAELRACGALVENSRNRFAEDGPWWLPVDLIKLAPDRLVQIFPQAIDTLKMHVAAHYARFGYTPISYGTFDDVQRELREFVRSPPGEWQNLGGERGDFVEGWRFTDTFAVHAVDSGRDGIQVVIGTRENLIAQVDALLESLRERLQGIGAPTI
ncbi:hypothetical protein [Burkholderia sp. Ac-20353]|uniref:hypothetical protein n=1 Tax=Burkholderia sp. Ac-20353 TaxID=2703894 RepID=UPI00197BAA2D|nr:hypothetical protein [Burkholderia sp. Ac-20353]MBN3786465.1 hypothetical protein [Burkholderia sp. Ac-20353]